MGTVHILKIQWFCSSLFCTACDTDRGLELMLKCLEPVNGSQIDFSGHVELPSFFPC